MMIRKSVVQKSSISTIRAALAAAGYVVLPGRIGGTGVPNLIRRGAS